MTIATCPGTALPRPSRRALVAALALLRETLAQPLRPWTDRSEKEARLPLALNATVSIRPAPGGSLVRCEQGIFLVTQEGDPEDHILEAGSLLYSRPRGRLAAWALEAGVLVVVNPVWAR